MSRRWLPTLYLRREHQKLDEEHEHGPGEDFSGKVDFSLAGTTYDVPNEQNDDHAEVDMLGSNDWNYMTNVLRDVVKPEARRNVFCSALIFSLWLRLMLQLKRKSETVTGMVPERGRQRARKENVDTCRRRLR